MSTDSLVWFSPKSLCGNPCRFTQPKTKFSPWGMICNICRQAFILWWLLNTFLFKFISVQVWLKTELKIDCCSNNIKIPFQILFYPFRCMFKTMKGYKSFDFTPSGKSLKKTLLSATILNLLNKFCFCGKHGYENWFSLILMKSLDKLCLLLKWCQNIVTNMCSALG